MQKYTKFGGVYSKKTVVILTILLFILFSGCQQLENCETASTRNELILSFFDKKTKKTRKVDFRISSDKIDSAGYLSNDSSKASLILNHNLTEQQFKIYSDSGNFSLQISFKPIFSVLSNECPPSIWFEKIDTINYNFDSLAIKNNSTQIQKSTHFEVYY